MCDSAEIPDPEGLASLKGVTDVDRTRCDVNTLSRLNRENAAEQMIWRRRDVPRAGQLLKRAKIRVAAQLSETQMDPAALLVDSDGVSLDVLAGWQDVLGVTYINANPSGSAAAYSAIARLPFMGFEHIDSANKGANSTSSTNIAGSQ